MTESQRTSWGIIVMTSFEDRALLLSWEYVIARLRSYLSQQLEVPTLTAPWSQVSDILILHLEQGQVAVYLPLWTAARDGHIQDTSLSLQDRFTCCRRGFGARSKEGEMLCGKLTSVTSTGHNPPRQVDLWAAEVVLVKIATGHLLFLKSPIQDLDSYQQSCPWKKKPSSPVCLSPAIPRRDQTWVSFCETPEENQGMYNNDLLCRSRKLSFVA